MLLFKCWVVECLKHWNYLSETAEETKEMFQTLKAEDVLVPLNLCSLFPVRTVDLPLKKATKPLQISIFHAVWITSKATWWCKSLPLTSKLLFPKHFPLKISLHEISPWGRVWPLARRLQALGAASPEFSSALQGQTKVFLGWDAQPAALRVGRWRGGIGGTGSPRGTHEEQFGQGHHVTITGGTCTLWVKVDGVWKHNIFHRMGRFCWDPSHLQELGSFSRTLQWETFLLPQCSSRHSETLPLLEEFFTVFHCSLLHLFCSLPTSVNWGKPPSSGMSHFRPPTFTCKVFCYSEAFLIFLRKMSLCCYFLHTTIPVSGRIFRCILFITIRSLVMFLFFPFCISGKLRITSFYF